jgi:Flp pilus assembly protein TadG
VTPLAVLSLTLLVSVVALVVDGGSLMEERRHAQATADAAALAAAADLFTNYALNQGTDPAGSAQSSALAYAAANGYDNDGLQSVVTVRISPQNYLGGPGAGQPIPPGHAEVTVQYNASRMFSAVFGSDGIPVRARAVARGKWSPLPQGLVLLNLTAAGVLTSSSTGRINVVNAGVQINTGSSAGISLSSGATVTASQFNLNKNANLASSVLSSLLHVGGGTAPILYGDPIPDPLRSLPDPDPVKLGLPQRGTNTKAGGGILHLYPGVYVGGIAANGGAIIILHANADGTPGIYDLQGGGLTVSGPSTIMTAPGETAGVMIYNDWTSSSDSINLSGSGILKLLPPATGPYTGVVIFQKRGTLTNPAPKLTLSGTGLLQVTGTVYAAYAHIDLSGGSSGGVVGGQIIADTMSLSGSATVNIDRQTDPVARVRTIYLVQ